MCCPSSEAPAAQCARAAQSSTAAEAAAERNAHLAVPSSLRVSFVSLFLRSVFAASLPSSARVRSQRRGAMRIEPQRTAQRSAGRARTIKEWTSDATQIATDEARLPRPEEHATHTGRSGGGGGGGGGTTQASAPHRCTQERSTVHRDTLSMSRPSDTQKATTRRAEQRGADAHRGRRASSIQRPAARRTQRETRNSTHIATFCSETDRIAMRPSAPSSTASADSDRTARLLSHAATAAISALTAAAATWWITTRRSQSNASADRARMLRLADAAHIAQHGMTPSEFNAAAHQLVDQITEYRATLRSRPVKSQVEPGYLAALVPASAPEEGESWSSIQPDIERVILPGMTHWGSPRFFSYFPAFASYPSLLGELLCSATNSIGFSWVGSPASTELETRCLDWVATLLDLPEEFKHSAGGGGGGCLQGTAAEAGAVAMLAAKAKALAAVLGDSPSAADVDATTNKLVAYISDQTHGIIAKGAKIIGIPTSRVRVLPTSAEHNYSLQLSTVQEAMAADVAAGLIPFFICVTIGTTSSTAIDQVESIAGWVSMQHPQCFLHIDAAYAGSFAALPELRPLFSGLRLVDSFSFNPHKSMAVAFDCSCFFVRQRVHLLKALSLANDGEYLRNAATDSGKVLDLKDWQLPFGRRFRSLKLWFTLRSYGAKGIRAHLRTAIEHARRFKQKIQADPKRWALVREPTHFGLVCFEAKVPAAAAPDAHTQSARNIYNEAIKERANATGEIFFISTMIGGVTFLRLACNGESQQNMRDVDEAWECIERVRAQIWKEKGWDKIAEADSSSSSSGSRAAASSVAAARDRSQ